MTRNNATAIPTDVYSPELSVIVNGLNKESDRSVVLIMGGLVDALLGKVLRAYFAQHECVDILLNGTLQFAARISLARALGIISDEDYLRLNVLRKIRNDMAHSFDSLTLKNFDEDCTKLADFDFLPPREKFKTYCLTVGNMLMLYAGTIKHRPPSPIECKMIGATETFERQPAVSLNFVFDDSMHKAVATFGEGSNRRRKKK